MSSSNFQYCDSVYSLSDTLDSSDTSMILKQKSVSFNETTEIFIIPVPSQKLHQQGLAQHKTVTFCSMVQVKIIPPRSKLADIFKDLWYAREDIENFAEEYDQI